MTDSQSPHARTVTLVVCAVLVVGIVPAAGALSTQTASSAAVDGAATAPDTSDAVAVTAGETVSGQLGDNETAVYAIDASAGDSLLARLELAATENETTDEPTETNHPALEVELVSPDGETIGFQPSGVTTNAHVAGYREAAGVGETNEADAWVEPGKNAAVATTNGTYYVRVTEAREDETGDDPTNYSLTVGRNAGTSVDPNEGMETATNASVGDSVSGDVHPFDAEWFVVELDAGERLSASATLSNTDAGADEWDSDPFLTQLTVRDANGSVVARSDGAMTGSDAVNYTAADAGTYYVTLESAGESQMFPGKEYSLTLRSETPSADTDTDGDGLSDAREVEIGTDPERADTDGDGLLDGREVNELGTDPTWDNTNGPDGDSVPEGVTDSDGDGLGDELEEKLGTDPQQADTDGDGIEDDYEIRIGSDPLDPDTDDDGTMDGEAFC